MSFSYSEHFFGQDWAHYASQASKLTAITCAVIGLISIFLNFQIIAGLISLLAGGILSIWEFPFVFSCFRNYEQIKIWLEERVYLKYYEGKGILSFIFGLLCFHFSGLEILSGFLLLVTGALFIFAAINRQSDQTLLTEARSSSTSGMQFPNALPLYHPIPSETTAFPKSSHNPPRGSSDPNQNFQNNSFGTFQTNQ